MKDKSRKPRRRAQPITLDPELTALAAMLAEREFDEGMKGWLVPRWRDGWNAVGFALDVLTGLGTRHWHNTGGRETNPDFEWLVTEWSQFGCYGTISTDPSNYWRAEEALVRHRDDAILTAAYRCYQVRTAHNSAGDGSIYNVILERAGFDRPEIIGFVESRMREHRCRDAIGETMILCNDRNDRLRQAFAIAWNRRLYSAAYALPHAE